MSGSSQQRKRQVQQTERFQAMPYHPVDKVDPVLLPQRMLACILRERMFCEVDVNRLQPMKKQLDAFEHLKIDRNNERLVKSLVYSHFLNKEVEKLGGKKQTNHDIIQGKAHNLIILCLELEDGNRGGSDRCQ